MTAYCNKCGLQYRRWNIKIEFQACEECDPEKFRKIYKTNINRMKRRTVGQEHITEHTFFPKQKKVNK